MNSTISDCTTSTMSTGMSSEACIAKPPALNAPNSSPAARMPSGRDRPSSATVIASNPIPASRSSRHATGDGAEDLVDPGEPDQATR